MNIVSPQELEVTGEQLLEMGDLGCCELVAGRIVRMSPTGGEHARIEMRIGAELTRFVGDRGWVLGGEVGIYTGRQPDTVRGADVAFLSRERSPEGPPLGFLETPPDVVIEIASPSDRWEEMRQKVEEYFGAGVAQVWVVEPENRTVLVYGSPTQVRKFSEGELLVGEGVLEGFALELAALFE